MKENESKIKKRGRKSGMREIYSRLELALKELKLLKKENEVTGFEGTDPD